MREPNGNINLTINELEWIVTGMTDLLQNKKKEWEIAKKIAYFNHHPEPLRASYKIDELEILLAKLQVFAG